MKAARKKNTLSLRIGIGAALLAVFVAVVFVSLIAATNEARLADRSSRAGSDLVSEATTARDQVVAAKVSDRGAVQTAASSALSVAGTAAQASIAPSQIREIRVDAGSYASHPRANRALLISTLGSVIDRQQAESSQRSSELDDALTRSLVLGVLGLIGSVISIILFGTDMLRSVTLPIRRVAAAARRLGSGDFTTRVPETGVADLKQLSASLNTMAESLDASRQALDQQHAELEASREEADRANQAKNEFLSRMSHELRTPLNAILGFAQLLEFDNLDARQRDNVAHIVAGGRHLLDLINEVLEISRIETGSMSPVIEPLNGQAIVREAIDLVGPLAAQRGIELKTEMPESSDVWIAADHQRLKQVLLNLLANAVKYNRDGGSVTVRLKPLVTRVQILVTDTGLGIPPDQLHKLFTPFERLGAEATGVEGTGLGLVLALRLAEAMGGTIFVESQPWIGSTFHVELPLADAPADAPAEARPVRLEAVSTPSGEKRVGAQRVLYIEDDAANAQLMAQLFDEEPRLELMTTMHGKLGLELARQHQPNLVLLDIHLPDIDGDEVLTRLRFDEQTRWIPVIVVSADATEEQRARMLSLGAERYLTKPLDLTAVLPAIWDVLGAEAA